MRNAQKIFISVLLLFALSLSASAAVTWTTATDAGYYDIDGEKHGLMRYLFHAETDGEVTESGINNVCIIPQYVVEYNKRRLKGRFLLCFLPKG